MPKRLPRATQLKKLLVRAFNPVSEPQLRLDEFYDEVVRLLASREPSSGLIYEKLFLAVHDHFGRHLTVPQAQRLQTIVRNYLIEAIAPTQEMSDAVLEMWDDSVA
jgi:hypothetical protein